MTPAQIAHFRTEGWLYQPNVINGSMEAMLEDLHRVAGWAIGNEQRTVTWTGPWITAERGHGYTPVRNLAEYSPLWLQWCLGLSQTASELLGGYARFANATAVMKPPEIGQTFPWHQDGAYYGPTDGRYVIANVYLDDVTPENGSLQVVPRSHDRLLPHDATIGKKAVELSDGQVPVLPPAKAGDVVWFHLWTIHGSGPNHSPLPRRAVRVGYVGTEGR